jgi:hypothetical protein
MRANANIFSDKSVSKNNKNHMLVLAKDLKKGRIVESDRVEGRERIIQRRG